MKEPFVMVPKCVLKMPAALLQVWIAIRFFDWEKKGRGRNGCRASAAEIGESINMSERMVRVHLHRLEACGAIRRVGRDGQPPIILCTPETFDLAKVPRSESDGHLYAKNPPEPRKEPSGVLAESFRGSEGDPGKNLPGSEQFPSGVDTQTFRGSDNNLPGSIYRVLETVETTEETAETVAGGLSAPPRPAGQFELLPQGAPNKPAKAPKPRRKQPEIPTATAEAYRAYATAYRERYQAPALGDRKTMAIMKSLIERLGAEMAPQVAAYYLTHSAAFYVQSGHDPALLLKDAQKLQTEMLTGRRINAVAARQQEQTAANPFLQLLQQQRSEEPK